MKILKDYFFWLMGFEKKPDLVKLKKIFDELIAKLPPDLVKAGEFEQHKKWLSLNFPGGILSLGETRGCKEATFHVFQIEGQQEYYCHYPIQKSDGVFLDKESLNNLCQDITRYKTNLL